ncbi:MAG: glycosyltransferase [Chloroflexi bacterium]|nr:glycosyltransferase [Chloroflexota bacterium]MBU1748887.1 glycosyltransferase [Chloroflexota bacterium]
MSEQSPQFPLVSIIIPAYNARAVIGDAIAGCLAQDYAGEVEVIVVDDGSTDDTGAVVQRYPVRYVWQANSGPATARNAGWRRARGEIVFFTDADCVPEPAWVSRLVRWFADEAVGGAGGTYGIRNPENLLAACVHEEIVQRHQRMPRQVDYLGGFNAAYRRRVLEQVEGFDEGYRTASAEDNDLSYRVKKLGYTLVFDAEARVAHLHPTALPRYLRRQADHGYWTMKLYRAHPDMAGGDAYARFIDHLEPPLCLLTLGLAPFALVRWVRYALMGLVGLDLVIQLPLALAIVRRTRRARYLALAPVTFLRGFGRAVGMLAGIVRFWLWPGPEAS